METDRWGDGTGTRKVVVSGVPDVLPVGRMVDKLTIHFQSCRRSRGGDVEGVEYPTNMEGVAFVTFDKAEDAERVVLTERHVMVDEQFPCNYRLTVFPFTRDVFLYVPRASVDLSVLGGDQPIRTLIRSLRSAHRSLHFRASLQHMNATVEGPFSAVQALRRDLVRRAGQLKSSEVSARASTTKLRETPLDPRVISHREVVGSVNCGGSKAKPGPGGSRCLSTPTPPTTRGATEVQRPLSNGKTRSASPRQKVSHESFEGEPRERSRQERPAEHRTELSKANPRLVLNAGVKASSSGPDLDPDPNPDLNPDRAEKVSATQPGLDGTPEKRTRPDRISAPEIRTENPNTDYLEDPDQSSSAFTAKNLRTKDVSTTSKSDAEGAEGPPATGPGDACVWVDLYTFKYMKRFDKGEFDRCLEGLEVRVELHDAELARISLTERQPSKTSSRVHWASEDLTSLVEFRSRMLRVHQINLDEDGPPGRRTLVQICKDVSALYADVLFLLEDSCVKVIGPSIPSHLFCRRVEDTVARLKDAPRT